MEPLGIGSGKSRHHGFDYTFFKNIERYFGHRKRWPPPYNPNIEEQTLFSYRDAD